MNNRILEVKGVSFKYESKEVLNDISFSINKGTVYGLIGPNGAGKTTLLKSLLGLLTPQKGKINLFGKSIRDNRVHILKSIGSCIEHPSLYYHLSAYDNLKIYAIYHRLQKSRIDEILNLVKLWEDRYKKVKSYSMGMKQRLVLAISIIHNPELIILDEPTNGLDPNANLEMILLLKQLNEKHDKTIIISSHKLNDLEKICSHVGLLKENKLIFNDKFNKNKEENFNLETFYFDVYKKYNKT